MWIIFLEANRLINNTLTALQVFQNFPSTKKSYFWGLN